MVKVNCWVASGIDFKLTIYIVIIFKSFDETVARTFNAFDEIMARTLNTFDETMARTFN